MSHFTRTRDGLSLLTLLSSACLLQAQPGAGGPMSFADLDRDHDGYVTMAEFAQHQGERMAERAAEGRMLRNAARAPAFADWDTNHDGRLTPEEFSAGQQAHRAKMLNGPPGM